MLLFFLQEFILKSPVKYVFIKFTLVWGTGKSRSKSIHYDIEKYLGYFIL